MAERPARERLERLIARDSARRRDRKEGEEETESCLVYLDDDSGRVHAGASPTRALSPVGDDMNLHRSILKPPAPREDVSLVQVESLDGGSSPRECVVTPDLIQPPIKPPRSVTFSVDSSPARSPRLPTANGGARPKEIRRVLITVYDDPPERVCLASSKPVPPPKPPELTRQPSSDAIVAASVCKSPQRPVPVVIVPLENGTDCPPRGTSVTVHTDITLSAKQNGTVRTDVRVVSSERRRRQDDESSTTVETEVSSPRTRFSDISTVITSNRQARDVQAKSPKEDPPLATSVTNTVSDYSLSSKVPSTESTLPRAASADTVTQNGHHPQDPIRTDKMTKPPLPPRPIILPPKPTSGVRIRTASARKNFFEKEGAPRARPTMHAGPKQEEGQRFERFRQQAQEERARLAASTPDLALLEASVMRKRSEEGARRRPEAPRRPQRRHAPPPHPTEAQWAEHLRKLRPTPPTRLSSAGIQRQSPLKPEIGSYLETDVDTLQCRTVRDLPLSSEAASLLDRERSPSPPVKPNLPISAPPMGRSKSEYELRVQKSLQNLSLPSWYRDYRQTAPSLLLRPRKQEGGWASYSRTSSLSNLHGARGLSLPPSERRKDSSASLKSSRESLLHYDWKLSRSSSSQSAFTPSPSAMYRSLRQPYLGWRASMRSPSSCGGGGTTPATPSPAPPLSCEESPRETSYRERGGDSGYLGSGSVSSGPTPPPPKDETLRTETTFGTDGSCHEIVRRIADREPTIKTNKPPQASPSNAAAPGKPPKQISPQAKPSAIAPKTSSPSRLNFSPQPPTPHPPRLEAKESTPAKILEAPPKRHSVSENDLSRLKGGPVLWIESSFVGRLSTTSVAVHASGRVARQSHCRCPGCRKYGRCYYASQNYLVASNP